MRISQKNEAASRRAGTLLPLFALTTLALLTSVGATPDSAPPKDHALFVGANLKVEDGSEFFELVGATGSQISLLADNKVHTMRYDAVKNVRIERTLKLSDVVAQVANLEITPTYVPTNRDRFAAMHQQMLLNDVAGDQSGVLESAESQLDSAQKRMDKAVGTPDADAARAALVNAKTNRDAANSTYFSTQGMANNSTSRAPSSGDNALEISCSLATPRTTHNTYALVITEFRGANDSKPSYKVHIESIGDLGPKPKQVTMTQDGLPRGFTLGRVGVHLFSDSKELATNLSEQRMDLTSDDAIRYLILCYVTAHNKSNENLAASPLRIATPADFKQKAPTADLERTLFLTIGTDGAVKSLSAASDRAVAVDAYVDSTVKKFRYNPAIQNGKAVESVVQLKLASLL